MKKRIAFILALLLACTAIVGCEKEEPQIELPKANVMNAGDADETSEPSENVTTETTSAETQQEMDDTVKDYDWKETQQGFSITGKKYNYLGYPDQDKRTGYSAGDVLLLSVKNETDTNYSIELTVTLFNEAGEKIKAETKDFEQYIAGYRNYFLFNTAEPFASYTCDLALTEYTGEIIIDRISYDLSGFNEIEAPDPDAAEQGKLQLTQRSASATKIIIEPNVPTFYGTELVVIFNKAGDIYAIAPTGSRQTTSTEEKVDLSGFYITLDDKNGEIAPEDLKYEYSYLVFPTEVTLGLWSKRTPEHMKHPPVVN